MLAGAIALGEARDEERHAYRAHLAVCGRCLHALGGERDIERTMNLVARARDEERWQPDIRRTLGRARNRGRLSRWAAGLAVAALAVGMVSALQHRPVPHSASLPAPALSAQQATAIAALGTQMVPAREHRAESLQFRGGASITLRVLLDAHGRPARCTVAGGLQPSPARAFCAAVMRTR